MKIKVIMIFLVMSFLELSGEETKINRQEIKALLLNAPLQTELVKVYKGSEKVGKKVGKDTKKVFCRDLKWDFFCKGGR